MSVPFLFALVSHLKFVRTLSSRFHQEVIVSASRWLWKAEADGVIASCRVTGDFPFRPVIDDYTGIKCLRTITLTLLEAGPDLDLIPIEVLLRGQSAHDRFPQGDVIDVPDVLIGFLLLVLRPGPRTPCRLPQIFPKRCHHVRPRLAPQVHEDLAHQISARGNNRRLVGWKTKLMVSSPAAGHW